MKAVLSFCFSILGAAGAPHLVSYVNHFTGWWPPSAIAASLGVPGFGPTKTYNVINLAFWTSNTGPVDAALVWGEAFKYVSADNPWGNSTAAVQAAWLKLYHDKGIKVLVSAFGATDFPTSEGMDPKSTCTDLGNFVKTNQLDGVDLDYEDNQAMDAGTGEAWVITCVQTLRQILPQSDGYILTHAPQAPYFMGPPKYPGGGYVAIDKAVGSMTDFYNIQFYNQVDSQYSTYNTLFQQSDGWAVGTSVMEMVKQGVDINKLVIGKPVTQVDAVNTGYLTTSQLVSVLTQGVANTPWKAGAMGWQYTSDSDGAWVAALAKALA